MAIKRDFDLIFNKKTVQNLFFNKKVFTKKATQKYQKTDLRRTRKLSKIKVPRPSVPVTPCFIIEAGGVIKFLRIAASKRSICTSCYL
jgi:hypothetical protein